MRVSPHPHPQTVDEVEPANPRPPLELVSRTGWRPPAGTLWRHRRQRRAGTTATSDASLLLLSGLRNGPEDSLEILDPVTGSDGEERKGLRFYVPVVGTPEQLTLVQRAARRGLTVGGDRSRGFGRLRLVEVADPKLASVGIA